MKLDQTAFKPLSSGSIPLTKNRQQQQIQKLQQAGQGFEAMFVKQMLTQMTNTLENGSIFGNTPGGDWYQDMFLQKVATTMAQSQPNGIAAAIVKQLQGNNQVVPMRDLDAQDRLQHYTELARNYRNPNLQTVDNAYKPDKQALAALKQKTTTDTTKTDTVATSPVNELKKAVTLTSGSTLAARLAQLEPIITQAALDYKVDTNLIKAVIAQESSAKTNAVSAAGAKGLMQLMDATAKELGVQDSFDVKQNIRGGTHYLAKMLQRFDTEEEALAAYNAGPGAVTKHNGVPPYSQTKHYIKKVQNYKEKFSAGGENEQAD